MVQAPALPQTLREAARKARPCKSFSLECLQIGEDVVHIGVGNLVQKLYVLFEWILYLNLDAAAVIEQPGVIRARRICHPHTEIIDTDQFSRVSLARRQGNCNLLNRPGIWRRASAERVTRLRVKKTRLQRDWFELSRDVSKVARRRMAFGAVALEIGCAGFRVASDDVFD